MLIFGCSALFLFVHGSKWILLILWLQYQRSRSFGSNVQKTFPIKYLRSPQSSNLVYTSVLDSIWTLLLLGSLGLKSDKTVSDCLSNNFPKRISSTYICTTYFELTYPVVQKICDKKILREHNVLQTSLVLVILLLFWIFILLFCKAICCCIAVIFCCCFAVICCCFVVYLLLFYSIILLLFLQDYFVLFFSVIFLLLHYFVVGL